MYTPYTDTQALPSNYTDDGAWGEGARRCLGRARATPAISEVVLGNNCARKGAALGRVYSTETSSRSRISKIPGSPRSTNVSGL